VNAQAEHPAAARAIGGSNQRPKGTPRTGTYAATIISRVRAIPRGLVSTYGDIDPHAPRAVGRVLATTHANVPWHRVVRADGTAAMGMRQLERLRDEGVVLRGDRVDFALTRRRWEDRRRY
jgi:methylated-DNA-protein-cysteine methyltransferase related protein